MLPTYIRLKMHPVGHPEALVFLEMPIEGRVGAETPLELDREASRDDIWETLQNFAQPVQTRCPHIFRIIPTATALKRADKMVSGGISRGVGEAIADNGSRSCTPWAHLESDMQAK